MPEFIYGTILLLELADDESVIKKELERIQKLGLNTVTIWPPIFYDDDEPYQRIRLALQHCHELGLKVIVELLGQMPHLEFMPDSLMQPEYAVTDADGLPVRKQNGLGECNFNHPKVCDILKRFLQKTVTALKDFPALFAWDVWNETHFLSHDSWTMKLFRIWLKKKYKTLKKLNQVWRRSYSCFSEVERVEVFWTSIMPGVDWELFRQDNLQFILAEIVKTIKTCDSSHPVIADNVMSNVSWAEFARGTNDWSVAGTTDKYGISFYPKTGGRLGADGAMLRTLTLDAAYSASGFKGFFISELQSHYYSELFVASHVNEEELTRWNLEAFSCGARGISYWKWRPFKRGIQVGGRGLVNCRGELQKKTGAVAKLGEFYASGALSGYKPTTPKAAILFDCENAIKVEIINDRVRELIGKNIVHKSVQGIYRACREINLSVDILVPGQLENHLKRTKILFLAYQLCMSQERQEKIKDWIEGGGVLLMGGSSLALDEYGTHTGFGPGGYLSEELGLNFQDVLQLAEDSVSASGEITLKKGCEIYLFETGSTSPEVLDTLGNSPLLYRSCLGKGQILYCAGSFFYRSSLGQAEGVAYLVRQTASLAGLSFRAVSSDFSLREGSDKQGRVIFVGTKSGNTLSGKIKLAHKITAVELLWGEVKINLINEQELELQFVKPGMAIFRY